MPTYGYRVLELARRIELSPMCSRTYSTVKSSQPISAISDCFEPLDAVTVCLAWKAHSSDSGWGTFMVEIIGFRCRFELDTASMNSRALFTSAVVVMLCSADLLPPTTETYLLPNIFSHRLVSNDFCNRKMRLGNVHWAAHPHLFLPPFFIVLRSTHPVVRANTISPVLSPESTFNIRSSVCFSLVRVHPSSPRIGCSFLSYCHGHSSACTVQSHLVLAAGAQSARTYGLSVSYCSPLKSCSRSSDAPRRSPVPLGLPVLRFKILGVDSLTVPPLKLKSAGFRTYETQSAASSPFLSV